MFEMFENSKKMYMVLELLDGGELFDRIVAKGSYSEKEASDVIKSVTAALQYLHEHNIVHRDLKPGQEQLERTREQRTAAAPVELLPAERESLPSFLRMLRCVSVHQRI